MTEQMSGANAAAERIYKAARCTEAVANLLAALDSVVHVPDAFKVLQMWLQQIVEALLHGEGSAAAYAWAPRTPDVAFLHQVRLSPPPLRRHAVGGVGRSHY